VRNKIIRRIIHWIANHDSQEFKIPAAPYYSSKGDNWDANNIIKISRVPYSPQSCSYKLIVEITVHPVGG